MPPILSLLCLPDTGMALFPSAVSCSLKRERNGIVFLDIRFTPLFDVSTKERDQMDLGFPLYL